MNNIAVAISLGNDTDLVITKRDDLAIQTVNEKGEIDKWINLGRATPERIDFLISCLTRLKVHTVSE